MSCAASVPWTGRVAAMAIEAYQRHLSPRKGFRCAHRALHHGPSCSEFGRRVSLRRGIFGMLPLLWRRLRACGDAARHLAQHKHQLSYESKRDPWRQPMHSYEPSGTCFGPPTARSSACDEQVGQAALELAAQAACECGPDACSLLHHM